MTSARGSKNDDTGERMGVTRICDGDATLPRRPVDYVLWVVAVLTILGALFIFAAGVFAAPMPSIPAGSSFSLPPTPTPTPTGLYRECPFCQRLYAGHASKDHTEFVFDKHRFISLPVTDVVRFETCDYLYYKHIGEILHKMQELGAGRFVEVPKAKS